MRGFLQPSVHHAATETQKAFRAFHRGRRTKMARSAHTTLVLADQWARGDAVPADIASALEGVVAARKKK